MKYTIVVTGSSSGFGSLSARALALAGHTVYATMRETTGRNAPVLRDNCIFAAERDIDLRTTELDVACDTSVRNGVEQIMSTSGKIDVLVHNAGHLCFGPAEAFTPEQLAELYDVNVISTQRVNRAVLPHMRKRKRGLLVWVSSSSCTGGTPPYLAPYFAAKAGMDSMAVVYARELARWGIETSIIVPGAFTSGTNHFAHASAPDDTARAAEYESSGPYAGFGERVRTAFAAIVPPDAQASLVADAMVKVVDTPFGKRPFRVHVDPANDGAEVTNMVMDRMRVEMLHRVGLADLLAPADFPSSNS